MSFGFDPEVPAGYQDADIEMAEMREAANEEYRRERDERARQEAVTLDEQDLAALIELTQWAFGAEFGVSLFKPESRPSTRMVNIKVLEGKLIKLKAALDE